MGEQQLNNGLVHIFNQGVDRRQIFLTREDYERFKAYLYILNDTESVRPANIIRADGGGDTYSRARAEQLLHIVAFALLPTHFHILAEPIREGGVALFMQKITTGYTMYFNARTLRSGTLFSSGYKSRIVERNFRNYARAYIHLTPAQFFHDDWRLENHENLKLTLGKISSYPYASLYEYQSNRHLITSQRDRRVNSSGELRLWTKRPKDWNPAF